ncbi:proton-coupled zinc antiporter SLC30A2-like isoform X1 [Cylas formicarius]|uniref:proton-coupled zinc antiporter SLC30A2-like isoform X1 n=1 Tax=Cylas formicarius TaxID=197179 RepID=UPI002958BF18|nr:proton-coupled zinc antiporter SLC30A2-like isoform X1 [Cylas formicarius]
MDQQCIHVTENEDHFMLDDENVMKHRCSKCVSHKQMWIHGNGNGNVSTKSTARYCSLTNEAIKDDQSEISEDSPLLININEGMQEHEDSYFHCHDSLSTSYDDPKAWRKLVAASAFCFLFMITELIGGYFAQSLAVMTDAAHLFSDFIGFLISILAISMGKKSRTPHMTFGYHRAEVVGAFLSTMTIWLLAAVFLVLALRRLYKEEYDIQADTMILVATLGLIVNMVMGAILHGMCHGHSHGTISSVVPQSSGNINIRAAAAHVLGDLLQSVGVLLAAAIIKIFPQAQAADPICTLIFSVIVIFTTAKVGKDSIWILMEGSPINRDRILLELKKLPNVKHVHDLYIWSLAPGRNIVSVHLAVDSHCDKSLITEQATMSIKSQIPIFNCTIQVEMYNPVTINSCGLCRV